MTAADITTPPFMTRIQAVKGALFIARRTRGADRAALLEECGLLWYEPAKLKARISRDVHVNYERPGH